jgi:fibro-slime domain-containing protein
MCSSHPLRLVLLSALLCAGACSNASIIDTGGPSGSGGSTTDGPLVNLDAIVTLKLDARSTSVRVGSDAPPGPNCGNSELTSDEACDDGNTLSGDGCANNCLSVEPGWSCVDPGEACRPIARCGDGLVVFPEQCDDGNKNAGDGCGETCKIEIGYKCEGSPSLCSHTTCGDSKIEGAEGCDDGNSMPFDGCSSDCQNEPSCQGSSACTSRCGDGIVLSEECDDGNNIDGDGCSSDCKIEAGFDCKQPTLGDKMMVPVVYRDFRYRKPSDFEAGVTGSEKASTGMVKSDLDNEGKPVFTGITGSAIHVEGTSTFNQWYRNTDGVNHATPDKLALWNNGNDAYVNRWGPNGEQWNTTETAYYCGNVGEEMLDADGNPIPCTSKYQDTSQTECGKYEAQGLEQLKCYVDGNSYKALYIVERMDGNPTFFPVDDDDFTPASERQAAKIPPYYDAMATWPFDVDEDGNKRMHNFSFTSEVKYWFKFEQGKSYKLDFVGDDDVWVFINKKLALDIGGIHTPVEGSVTLDAASAAKFGMSPGNVYEAAVFQAERQTEGSSYKLTLSGFNAAPSDCQAVCGDGILAIGEECDDGEHNGDTSYGGCSVSCTLGEFCGDGIINGDEMCDDGGENGLPDKCPSGCRILFVP